MRTAIKSPVIQYSIGVLVNLFYIAILISTQTSYQNIQLPENNYSENFWKGGDVLTYVQPARNFVKYQIFGRETIPDYSRTIGYPLFLATLMMVFGSHWLISAFLLQAAIFALMYPLLSRISNILFNTGNSATALAFLFLILCGTYIVRVPVIMTDTFFTVFFTLGLWLGLESILKRSYTHLLLHLLFVGYAAQVRPVLSLYPIINCFILASIVIKYGLCRSNRIYIIITTSFICLSIFCNLPLIRNYVNYNFHRPSHIFSNDLLEQLGRHVLIDAGKKDEYEEIQKMLQEVNDINMKTHLQEKLAFKIYRDYPLITLKWLIYNAIGILGRAHWPFMANFWGYSFKDDFNPAHMPVKKTTVVYFIEVFFNIAYVMIFFLFMGCLIRVCRSENIVFSLGIVFFIAYFLTPTFIERGGGSRYRLPVEGLIVIMASCQVEHHFKVLNDKLFRLINGIYALLRVLRAYLRTSAHLNIV
jgi:hypothetical protein